MKNSSSRSVYGLPATVGIALIATCIAGGSQNATAAELAAPVSSNVAENDALAPEMRREQIRANRVVFRQSGRSAKVAIHWHRGMISRPGKNDRFVVRLVSFSADKDPVVLRQIRVRKTSAGKPTRLQLKFAKKQARQLKRSDRVVLTASQLWGKRSAKRLALGFVTVSPLKITRSAKRAGTNCARRQLAAGAQLAGCDLRGAWLNKLNLAGANLRGAQLGGSSLTGVNLNNVDLSNAHLDGVISGGISGKPKALPAGWILANGYLRKALGQTVSFGSDPHLAQGVTRSIEVTSSAGAQISLTSLTPDGCSVSGREVTGIRVGVNNCVLRADAGATGNFQPGSATQVLSVAIPCAAGGTCYIGDIGPGGGTVFYSAPAYQDWGRYLEVAPKDWDSLLPDRTIVWSCKVTSLTGARATGIGAGRSNTAEINSNSIANDCTSASVPNPTLASQAAASYRGNGFDDWFIGSHDEMNQLCRFALRQDTTSLDPCRNSDVSAVRAEFVPDSYQPTPDGAAIVFWTSTQKNGSSAYAVNLVKGAPPYPESAINLQFVNTSTSIMARPIRAF